MEQSQNSKSLIRSLRGDVANTVHEPYLVEMSTRYSFLLNNVRRLVNPGARMLDAGASPGLFTELLRRSGYECAGLDMYPDERFPADTGVSCPNLFFKFKIPVIKTNMISEPFPVASGAIDAIMLNETIEHLEGSPLPCLKEMHRVLKPDGLLFLTTPNVTSLANRLRFLSGKNIHTTVEILVNVQPYKLHNREYTMSDLEKITAMAGFGVKEKKYMNLGGKPGGTSTELARKVYYAATEIWPQGKSNLYLCAVKR